MLFRCFALVFLYLILLHSSQSLKFEDITSDVFGSGDDAGIIAAFAHSNTDEFTDVISLKQGGNKLILLKGTEDTPYFQTSLNCSFKNIITGVVPADFNGDSTLDFLIVLSKEDELNDIRILWGGNNSIDCTSEPLITVRNHPLVLDFNGDMRPDIIADAKDYKTYVWLASEVKIHHVKFTPHLFRNNGQTLRSPHSSGLIDLNNDMAPDILIMEKNHIETWYNTGQGFVQNTSIPYPNTTFQFQSTFVDMNLDGKVNHIMPVCYNQKCTKSAVMIWNDNHTQWEELLQDFVHPVDNSTWGFKLTFSGAELEKVASAVTLRAGDVDMDGYPDFITVLQSKKNIYDVRAVIMRNVPCDGCFSHRKLEIVWDVPGLKDLSNVLIASFFDIYEDGTLDILVSTNTKNGWKIHALKNTEIFDSCFLKVLVLGGLCRKRTCTTELYGVNQPGPMIRYNMTTQDGQPLVSTSIQLSQSAHFPLQLPYSLFGLGQTPNFIDVLTVSIPFTYNQSVHKRDWIQIIPNSQIVVIPNPPGDETKWMKKLFVTPSHLVFLTCISLIGTCIFITILVAILHWKERLEDKKEKMQDAYRFHFDAM